MGDFNVVKDPYQKLGGSPVNTRVVTDFNDVISKAGVMDGGYNGRKYTWCSNRVGKATIFQRIDRALYNSTWNSKFITYISHLNKACSDHTLLNININLTSVKQGGSFKFLNLWTKHHEFKQLVNEVWCQPERGRPMVRFANKLKKLKAKLKD